jgi:hypothetical protein
MFAGRNLRDAPDKTPGSTFSGRFEQDVTAPLGAAQTKEGQLSNGVGWTLRLSVWNAFGTDEPTPVRRNPDGALAVFRIAPPTNVSLTSTFKF